MEFIDVLTQLKNKGYHIRSNERRQNIAVGSWKTLYRLNVCKNATGRFCIEGGSNASFISGLLSALFLSTFLLGGGILNTSLSNILFSLAMFVVLIMYMRFINKKEQAAREDIDQILFDLQIAEYKTTKS